MILASLLASVSLTSFAVIVPASLPADAAQPIVVQEPVDPPKTGDEPKTGDKPKKGDRPKKRGERGDGGTTAGAEGGGCKGKDGSVI